LNTLVALAGSITSRIYREYLSGRGLKQIAYALNDEGVAAPSAGRRGGGSWASSAVRTILLCTGSA
jgi:hypothetical protein